MNAPGTISSARTGLAGAPKPRRAAGPSRFRRTLLWLHTWVGLSVGLAMLFLAVTGGIVVLRPLLDDAVYGKLLHAPACSAPLPLDDLAQKAKAAHPADKLKLIELRNETGTSAAVQFSNGDYVYMDPCSGRVLGAQNEYGGLFGFADGLHRFRFLSDAGRTVAGTANLIALIVIVIGGLILWWPRNRAAIKPSVTYNRKLPGLARTLSLHRAIGIYAAALLLALTVTGVPISFGWAKNLIQVATGSSPDGLKPPVAISHGKPIKMEAVWTRIKAEAPNWTWAAVSYPKAGVVGVEYLEQGAAHTEAKSHMYLDAHTGAPIRIDPFATRIPLGRKVYLYIIALHSGLVGGIPFELALFLACAAVPVQVYSGFTPYIRKQLRKSARSGLALKVVGKQIEADDVCSFELTDPRGRPLPAFSAGSHIDLTVQPGMVRQFSLCNDPRETHRYLIAVMRRDDSRGGSSALHDEIQVGDVLQSSLPKNHFPLAHGPAPSVLIAGGIGITPILCMAERLANIGEDFELHYAVSRMSRAVFAERIAQSAFAARVSYHVSGEGTRLDLRSMLTEHDRGAQIYVCGPPGLIDDVIETALALGWPEGRIHREYFVAAHHDTATDKPFEVKLASTGQTVLVPKDRSVVQALAEVGVEIPTSCSEGVCGTCLTRVLEGTVVHRDRVLSAEEQARNDQFTPCCSRSVGARLVLDL